MRKILKYAVAHTYKPLLVKYLSRTRTYYYRGISLVIPPEVFHPGFFFSTKLLLDYLSKQPLQSKSFLELGAGSGLIATWAARKGARVVATDINPVAVRYLESNSQRNCVGYEVILSDLFNQLPVQHFDVVAINPPYYKKKPVSVADYAWCCGEHGEYFVRLFKDLGRYLHQKSIVFMVLSDQCDLKMIEGIALDNGYSMRCVRSTRNLLERNFIFTLDRS
ncbi:MAG: methyltransferase [Chitinophagaceae bacterium]